VKHTRLYTKRSCIVAVDFKRVSQSNRCSGAVPPDVEEEEEEEDTALGEGMSNDSDKRGTADGPIRKPAFRFEGW
jgi:hypothetical protein